MLVDIDHLPQDRLLRDTRRIDQAFLDKLKPIRLQQGVYTTRFTHNFEHCIRGILVDRFSTDWYNRENMPEIYGVADDIPQVRAHLQPWWADDDYSFVISVDEVVKADQEPQGGWRWHKWGSYIGTQTPTCEYLYDEPVINKVLCFGLHQVHLPVQPPRRP